MKIKTIALAFGLLLVIGTFMLAVEAFSTDGPAGPISPDKDGPAGAVGGVYEVTMPGILFPGDELTPDEFKMLILLGVLRPEGVGQPGTQYAAQDGERCHLKVYGQGTDIWVFCDLGPGTVNCACSWGTDPATE